MTRRGIRAHSAEAALRAIANVAAGPLAPPKHVKLRREDKPFWIGVMESRARDEWTPADLIVAAQLARCQADAESESRQLAKEGYFVIGAAGGKIVNPRAAIIDGLERRAMAMMRSLRMGGRAAGHPQNEHGLRELERRTKLAQSEVAEGGDGLLA